MSVEKGNSNNDSNMLIAIATIMMMMMMIRVVLMVMVMMTTRTRMMINLGKERKEVICLSRSPSPVFALPPLQLGVQNMVYAYLIFYFLFCMQSTTRTKEDVLQNQWHVPILYILLCFNKPLIACYAPYIRGDTQGGNGSNNLCLKKAFSSLKGLKTYFHN